MSNPQERLDVYLGRFSQTLAKKTIVLQDSRRKKVILQHVPEKGYREKFARKKVPPLKKIRKVVNWFRDVYEFWL